MGEHKESKFLIYFLYTGTILTTTIYIVWRIFFTLPFSYGIIAIIAGVLLLIAEISGMLEALQHYYGMGKSVVPEKPILPRTMFPEVDIFIATYNEDAQLLYKTINGCKNMNYPDKHKVHIYLCDDSNRIEMKQLCDELGIGYLTRDEHIDAKAGNLNNAMKHTSSPYIVTFDADMIPLQNFLMDIVPYMFLPQMIKDKGIWRKRTEDEIDENYNIGFIQSPQSFYNADLFQYYLFSEKRVPNEQDYFYRDVQLARNKTNSAIYGGSNTIISRRALEEIGGFYTGVITEDFATGISIQAKGYTTYAIHDVLAIGLAPSDLKSLIKQRERWARGCIQTLKKVNVLTKKGLSIGQRISYLSSLNYWYTPYRRLLYIMSPILFTVFHIMVVDCTLPEIILFWLPQYIFNNVTMRKLSGNIRNTRWSNVYDTILFPSLLIPVFKETIGIKQHKFSVTNKNREENDRRYQVRQALPHMMLLALSILGMIFCIYASFKTNSIAFIVIIFWLMINTYTLSMSIFFMFGRKVYRSSERFYIEEGVIVHTKCKKFSASSIDLSDDGISLACIYPEYIDKDEIVKIDILSNQYACSVYAKIAQITRLKKNKWKYGFILVDFETNQKDTYFHLLYDRIPDLPKYMDDSSSLFDDLSVNIHQHFQKNDSQWSRKLPRLKLQQKAELSTGKRIKIVNFNFEYIVVKMQGKVNKIQIPLSFDLNLEATLVNTHQVEHLRNYEYLYKVDNLNELIHHEDFHHIIREWTINHEESIANKIEKKGENMVLFNENNNL